jgi:hypothetical protein
VKFGFMVTHKDFMWDDNFEHVPTDRWEVALPHQCDMWSITTGDICADGLPHEQAVARLSDFIAEAQQALAALIRKQEVEFEREEEE